DVCHCVGVGGEPHVLATGAADRPAAGAERGGGDLIGRCAVRAGDQHRRIVPGGFPEHASRPSLTDRKPWGTGLPMAPRRRARPLNRPKGSPTPMLLALRYKVRIGGAAALRRGTWFGSRTSVCATAWGPRSCATSTSASSRIPSSF